MSDPPRVPTAQTLAQAFGLAPHQARVAFGALRMVVEADGPPGANGLALLAVAASTLALGDDWRAVPGTTPAEITDAFPSADARRLLVDSLLIPACIEGEVSAAGEVLVRSLAAALGVRSHWVRVLGPLRRRRVFAVKRQLVRRSPDARRLFARTWAEEGLLGMWRALRFVLGLHVDPPLAARFRGLGALPPGTLGRRFFDHFTARGLAFPGEPGGLPERMIHHDLMHVVNDYGTDPAGECELAGFYAAFCPGDAFTFVVIVLATFQLGLPVSPAVVLPARGAFDPARFIAAFLRGRQLRIDVMGPWDYWALMPLPIDAAREHLGITDPPAPPGLPGQAAA
ncbi:MAG: hypothetical protein H0T76_28510 [Nannocystis sp.]|nr:hypothetical protein [Nannocystis sp.]MBA3550437.1 hypothetical protein [Nannocystis sp.]